MPADCSLQVERLYHAARQHSPGECAVFLENACADDTSLRHEVEALLAEDAGVESFLETPALETVAKEFAENLDQPLIGRRIGSYQILSLLGTGGMGEVYRASDTRLCREVALKVLPAVFAQDAERLARFQREARLSASLNHPNVTAIYGMEESDGLSCLIMELVPGQTLAEAGPLPLVEALTICRQIAEGLEEAHRKNITHRDIKPANIKVTPEGMVKILDFGLAKALVWEQPEAGLSRSSVDSLMASQDGKILGTPDYMSPEQVRGKRVEKQADIWAFGCVLYELLSGKHAFHGDTLTDTISKVLTQEPDWQTLSPATPPKVRELLRRCLTKDVRHRLQHIGDARIEIEEALAIAGTTRRSHALRRGTILAALGGVVALVAGLVTWTNFRHGRRMGSALHSNQTAIF